MTTNPLTKQPGMTSTAVNRPTTNRPAGNATTVGTTDGVRPKASPKAANSGTSATLLKSVVVIGSLVATILGANLAAKRDQVTATSAAVPTTLTNVTTQPWGATQAVPSVPNLDATANTLDQLFNTPLAPIPTIKLPTVTTRSQSSR